MKITIVDYGSGNLRSVAKAFERSAVQIKTSVDVVVSADPADVATADRVVLPGVGAFGECSQGIAAIDGLRGALREFVEVKARPFLGICVGMQLMADEGEEHGVHKGFGWISGRVKALKPADPCLKIPHMGWNELESVSPHPVLEGLMDAAAPHAYFVHSYGMEVSDRADLIALTDYAGPIAAIIAKDNMFATQFHPEKSQDFGLALLEGFMRWNP
jgi:imidazole glycerol-phosphate synthase subunit HisH